MKLTVFSRSLSKKPTGRGVVAREIVAAMLKSDRPPEVDLFCAEEIGLEGARFHPARGKGLIRDIWRTFFGISREIERLAPDVFWATTHFLPRGLAKTLPKAVTLLDLVWKDHPETLSGSNRRAARWLESGLWEADRIVCISNFTKDRLIAHFPALADRAEVVHLGPNPRLLSGGAGESPLPDALGLKKPYVLTVGTFEPRKNLPVILEAMKELRDVTLVHCGHPGWNVSKELDHARRLPNVRILGFVDEPVLAALYRNAAVCVFPSLYEGFHIPPLDAALVGAPLLLSDIPVHREILGDAAAYASPSDASGFAHHIRRLVDSEGDRLDLSRKAAERARQFSWEKAGQSMMAVFERLRGRGAAR